MGVGIVRGVWVLIWEVGRDGIFLFIGDFFLVFICVWFYIDVFCIF